MTHPHLARPTVGRAFPLTTGLRLLVVVLLIAPMAGLSSSAPAHAEPTLKVTGPKTARQTLPVTPSDAKQPKIAAAAISSAERSAINIVNAHRARYGARALPANELYSLWAKSHANYCQLNGDVATGCTRPYSSGEWENPSKRGFTSKGSDYASYMLMVPTSSPTNAINVIMHDPGYRDGWLLDLAAQSIGIGTVGGWTMVLVNWSGAPSGYPKIFPRGYLVSSYQTGFDLNPTDQAKWTQGCPSSSRYGFPISAQWDYTRYGMQTRSYGTLYRDGGGKQWTCMVSNRSMLLNGQAVMVPMGPLAPGAIYSGSITATFPYGGTTQTVTMPISFNTWAPATGVAGDQSGDRVGDFMAIRGSTLYFRKMNSSGTLRSGYWVTSSSASSITWLGRAPDLNGDKRDDLMVRYSNGDIYIWYGRGMGTYTTGPRIGVSWNSMNLIVPIGDMNGDGTPELIARHVSGDLYRYTIFTDKITNKVKIGRGWTGMDWMVGIGKYTADNRDDMVSVDKAGDLWLWPTTPAGAFAAKKKIGRGWNGYTYMFSHGDINNDGRPDLLARDRSGTLYTWFNTSRGLARVYAGSGWGDYRVFG